MSLAAGPGRAGGAAGQLPDELKLVVEKHVAYIQSLDTVRPSSPHGNAWLPTDTNTHSSAAMNSNTTSPSTCDSVAFTGV